MSPKLPARPNLDHLRRQAKTLLASQEGSAKQTMRLADAQLIVANDTGFANWPALTRHVQQLRALEGRWTFASLEIDGAPIPAAALTQSALLIDGDRFRTESPEANYDGIFNIDVEATPHHIDIEFIEGPEAGHWSYGIFEFNGDELIICLGLTGAARPTAFATAPGRAHALERLVRADTARPAHVTGGTRAPASQSARHEVTAVDASAFDAPMTPLLESLQGEWLPTVLVMDGKPMPAEWLSFGQRRATGNEVTVAFGGQVQVHANVRIDDSSSPIAVDYLNLAGPATGKISHGIFEWRGSEACFLMAKAGAPRPAHFGVALGQGLTLSQWTRKIVRP